MIRIKDKNFKLAISADEIENKIADLAEVLNRDYADKNPILLGILNGSFMFAADLVRHLTFPHQMQFVKVSSYEGMDTTGQVKEIIGITTDIKGRDIILVEDIVDTGTTMSQILPTIHEKGVKSVEICTFLTKPDKLMGKVDIKYCAFEIPNLFVVGYGLDYDGYGRNYKDLYVLAE